MGRRGTEKKKPIRKRSGRGVPAVGQGDLKLSKAIARLGLPSRFPSEALEEAEGLSDPADSANSTAGDHRRDLRGQPHVTIDGEDARDFDDAISAKREGDGYRVWISIADVASYVQEGTALDKEARLRGTSVYFPRHVIPMLPERLSNGLCSLVPGQSRLTLTCEMYVRADGGRGDLSIYPSLIESSARLTYDQVQQLIDGKTDAMPGSTARMVRRAIEVSGLLRKRRFARGSLDLEIPEPRVLFDSDGEPSDVVASLQNPSHHVIEDLMVAANEAVAEYLLEHRLAGLFRVHPPPPGEKWAGLKAWSNQFGFRLKREAPQDPMVLARFLKRLRQTPQADAGQFVLLRSLAQAYYASGVHMHYGLASTAYVHFTSPIRRYPDLLVHRALWNHWQGKRKLQGLDELAASCSATERRAIEAEREIHRLVACSVARRRIGEEMQARVVGIHVVGLFVRPVDLFAEGLIPIKSLGRSAGEYLEVLPEIQTIVGRLSGMSYRLGDPVKVRLSHVDLKNRQLNFELAQEKKQKLRSRAKRPARKKRRTRR